MVTYHPNSTAVCGIQNLNLRTKRSSMILTLSDKKATFLGGVKSSGVACHSEVLFDGEKPPKMHLHYLLTMLTMSDIFINMYICIYAVIIINLIYKHTMDLWNAWTGFTMEMAIQQHANDAPCPQPWLFYPGGRCAIGWWRYHQKWWDQIGASKLRVDNSQQPDSTVHMDTSKSKACAHPKLHCDRHWQLHNWHFCTWKHIHA